MPDVVIEQEAAPVPAVQEPPLTGWLRVIDRMIDKGMSAELLTKVFELQQKADAEMQRKAFVEAFSKFKAEAPAAINRTGHVGFQAGGKQVGYDHVELDVACTALTPILSKNGLAHSWESTQAENGLVTVSCRLEHVAGHSRSVTLRSMPDQSGSKNPIQAVGSTIYYLERYTLLAVLGIAQAGADSDAGGNGGTITVEQVDEIAALIEEKHVKLPAFQTWLKSATGADKITEIPAASFAKVVDMLRRKK